MFSFNIMQLDYALAVIFCHTIERVQNTRDVQAFTRNRDLNDFETTNIGKNQTEI